MVGQSDKEIRKSQHKLILCLILFVFLVMLGYTIIWEIDYYKRYGFFTKTTANVIEHETIEGNEYDVIEYTVNGVEFHKTTEYLSKNEVGDKIIIYYDETNPIGVIYSIDIKTWLLPVLTSVFGVAIILLIILYINYYKKQDTAQTD